MESAYSLKDLGERLVATGLPLAEDALEAEAGKVYVALKAWLKESAALSPNKIDDVIAPFVDQLDGFVLPQIDKINGRVG